MSVTISLKNGDYFYRWRKSWSESSQRASFWRQTKMTNDLLSLASVETANI